MPLQLTLDASNTLKSVVLFLYSTFVILAPDVSTISNFNGLLILALLQPADKGLFCPSTLIEIFGVGAGVGVFCDEP